MRHHGYAVILASSAVLVGCGGILSALRPAASAEDRKRDAMVELIKGYVFHSSCDAVFDSASHQVLKLGFGVASRTRQSLVTTVRYSNAGKDLAPRNEQDALHFDLRVQGDGGQGCRLEIERHERFGDSARDSRATELEYRVITELEPTEARELDQKGDEKAKAPIK